MDLNSNPTYHLDKIEEIIHIRTDENSSNTNIKEAKGKHAVKETWKEGSKRRIKQEQYSQTWGGNILRREKWSSV